MPVSLFPHNQTAYENVCAMLEKTGKAAVIHPTGTGKSFIGFQYAAEHPQTKVLWLAPSDYIFRTQMENWNSAGGEELKNITFLTYAKLSIMTEEELLKLVEEPNVSGSSNSTLHFALSTLIVADEFHRAGALHWGMGFQRLLSACPSATILGLTATHIRYLDSQRDMAQELFDGNIASEMSLGEAIVRGILPAPKYVLSIFKYRDDLAKYELRARHARNKATRDAAEEILEKLRRALDLAEGLEDIFDRHMTDRTGKYLVFCANAEHMRDMIARVPDWFYKVDEHPHVYSAYSEDPETDRAFADFKADTSDHLKLLFCIDMLNEGIHVPDVSGVILLRPTVSPIVYKQQIGRALSASHSSSSISHSTFNISNSNQCPSDTPSIPLSTLHIPHYPTSPVIFDIVMNIENLYSISSLQEEMEIAMTYYRSLGLSELIITDGFEVVDEVHDCLELFDRLNETLTTSWDLMYEQAVRYAGEYGNLDVTRRYVTSDGYTLGSWLATQRLVRAGKGVGVLTPERIEKLDAIGMRWKSAVDVNWEKYYGAAEKYREEHGNLKVRLGYVTSDGVRLGNWISNMRRCRKSGIQASYLTPERIAELDRLGMQWDVPDYLFERNFAAAMEYHRTHGDLNVPARYVDPNGIKLGAWINRLRMVRQGKMEGTLDRDQIDRLNAIGMSWANRHDLQWEEGYRHAKEYYESHGNLILTTSGKSPDGFRLGRWLSVQRSNRDSMKPERMERLNAIGMQWNHNFDIAWDQKFQKLKEWYREKGSFEIPYRYRTADGTQLGKWLARQRTSDKTGELSPDRRAKLDALGAWR